jgi:hypothetical protein
MTQRHDNVGRILAQVIHIHAGQNLIKSFTDNYVKLEQKNQITTRN